MLQEREYVAQQAQRASVRRPGESAPGPALGDIVAERIGGHQLETGDAVWDSWKREDNTWQVKLAFLIAGEERVAHWIYEPRRRSVAPADEEAVRFSSPDAGEPLGLGSGSANVTPFVPRRQGGAAAEPPTPKPEPTPRPEPTALRPDTQTSPPEDSLLPSARPDRSAAPGRVSVTPERAQPTPAAQQEKKEKSALTAARRAPEAPTKKPDPAAKTAEPPEQPKRPERPERSAPDRPAAEPPAAQRPAPKAPRSKERAERPEPYRQGPSVSAAAAGTGGSPQPARRKSRSRRASVPSWDEIMFGSKKPD